MWEALISGKEPNPPIHSISDLIGASADTSVIVVVWETSRTIFPIRILLDLQVSAEYNLQLIKSLLGTEVPHRVTKISAWNRDGYLAV